MSNYIGPIIIIAFVVVFVVIFILASKYGNVSTRSNNRNYRRRNSVRIGRLTISSKAAERNKDRR